ncbi:unnamed protein product [Brachionus calyciflorus]|uniref:Uncharacterized protein n=1 Tax=Brachionus calyciflorus TaxID=104777 RepID=A0A814CH26_9BILA|nr:unnamed protein product [Brachionus calyciflorus]
MRHFIFFSILIIEVISQNEFDLIYQLTSQKGITFTPELNVNLEITLNLRKIVGLDEKNKIMSSDVYVAQKWVDKRLRWNVSQYENINHIVIQAKKIWLPDLAVLNTVEGDGIFKVTDSNYAIVFPNGTVYLILSANGLKTKCNINAYKFPFDVQTCSITIGSWTMSKYDIEINDDKESLKLNDVLSSSWDFLDWDSDVAESNERFHFDNYISNDVKFYLKLRRRPLYFMVNGVLPCLVLNLITALAFFIPFASQVSLTMTIILTFSIYSLRVANDIPVQSDYLPLITVYFMVSTIYSILSLIWFIAANHMLAKSKIPSFMLKLSKLFFTGQRKKSEKIVPHEIIVVDVSNEQEKLEKITIDKKMENIEKRDDKLDDKKLTEKIIIIWNYIMFALMFSTIFICNLVIWITIGL